ncbi:MAG: hypothetical protein V7603_6101 [Micromonosporaceae bacterium]
MRAYYGTVSSARLRPYLYNAALALVLALVSVAVLDSLYRGPLHEKLTVAYFGGPAGLRHALLIWWLASASIVIGLLIRHRWPPAALILVTLGAARHLFDPRFGLQALDLAVPVVLYTVARTARARWISVAALAAVVAGDLLTNLVVQNIPRGEPSRPATILSAAASVPVLGPLTRAAGESFGAVLILVLAVAVGDGLRSRRLLVRSMEQHAADARREERHRAALAEAAERARISRELHDVVAHSLSVIVVQAQGAAAALEHHPARAATAVQHVVDTGRGALAEMRRLLGLVRQGRDSGSPALAEPGVGALSGLVEEVSAAGLAVRLRVDGEPVALPANVDLSAYRIVQEALTNALKHAGTGAQATVCLRFAADTVEVEITDDGPGLTGDATGGGYGLRGIAERVDLLGGELTVGSAGTAGFRILARLPIGAAT